MLDLLQLLMLDSHQTSPQTHWHLLISPKQILTSEWEWIRVRADKVAKVVCWKLVRVDSREIS